MFYLIIICIAVYIIYKLYGGAKAALEFCFNFFRKHKTYGALCIIVIICIIYGWSDAACLIGIGAILGWIIKAWLEADHQKEFLAWLNENANKQGKTSAEILIEKGFVPEDFLEYSYPSDSTALSIVKDFLYDSQSKLEGEFRDELYDEIQSAGMVEEKDVKDILFRRFEKRTRTESLTTIFNRSVEILERCKKIDRPVKNKDKAALHCIGAANGEWFESDEIDLGNID